MSEGPGDKQGWFTIVAIVAVVLLGLAGWGAWYMADQRANALPRQMRQIATGFHTYAFDNKRFYPDHAAMLLPSYLQEKFLTHPFGPLPGHVATFTAPPTGPVYRLGDFIFPYMPGTKLGNSGAMLVISVAEEGSGVHLVAFDDGSVLRYNDDATFAAALDNDYKTRREPLGLQPITLKDIKSLERSSTGVAP